MRARNIKPGFFENDLLAECDPLARLLFAGLWCAADREGRLQDRPRYLKGMLLRFDNCDVDQLLSQLAERGFIERYEVDGRSFIRVVNFLKHQRPYHREQPSTAPPPGGEQATNSRTMAVPSHGHDPNQEGPEPEQDEAMAALIPDTGYLIPDSGFLEEERDTTGKPRRPRPPIKPKGEKFKPPSLEEVADYASSRGSTVDPVAFVDFYTAQGRVLSNGRKMADWRATFCNWERRDNKAGKHEPRTEANARGIAGWLNGATHD